MLGEVLAGNRIFAVAALDDTDPENQAQERPHPVAGIGMVRACHTNEDGSSNLVLQGLARVHLGGNHRRTALSQGTHSSNLE